MGSWWSELTGVDRVRVALVIVVCLAGLPHAGWAQSVSAADRDALVRLRVERGGRAEDVEPLIRVANEAGANGLPVAPLVSKIREGLAKNADPARIQAVVAQMSANLETADRLLRELPPAGNAADRAASITLLADALGSGVSAGDVGEIRKLSERAGKTPALPDAMAGAAKGLAMIKEVRLPATEGTAVMAEAVRQGYRSREMLDLGREIKRRERDYREGRASLIALRDAIARGSRPEQLFRDGRGGSTERPAATDPATSRPEPVTRPERPTAPERPQPPERPVRPERPATGR